MPAVTRLSNVSNAITLVANRSLSPAAQQQRIAAFARQRLAGAQQSNKAALGKVPPHVQLVDGSLGGQLERVRPEGGRIEFRFEIDMLRDVLVFALQELRSGSPVISGDYRNGFSVYVNGEAVEGVPEAFSDGDEIAISNPVPYARRIEVGMTKSGRSFVMQIKPRFIERIAKRVLIPRFGKFVKIEFNYWNVPDAHIIKGKLASHYQTTGYGGLGRRSKKGGTLHWRKRRQKVGEAVQAPAIFFTPLR